MQIKLPEFCLVLLVGPSGCGKTTFAQKHFRATEVLSSDACRAMVSDSESCQAATGDAFEVLHLIAEKRLAARRLTVIDATNLQVEARRPLLKLARDYHAAVAALVFDLPAALCQQRNLQRPGRQVDPGGIERQFEQLQQARGALTKEGAAQVVVLNRPEQVDAARISREKLPNNQRGERGPLDIIGDIHGCAGELEQLLEKLGYQPAGPYGYTHPQGRKAVFLGDLTDRGPRILDAFRIVHEMTLHGQAYCVMGNHDDKLLRWLKGRDVTISQGFERTLNELKALPPEQEAAMRHEIAAFITQRPSHLVFDGGRLVVAHAGIKKAMIGRESARIRAFTLYGDPSGEIDENGLPVRYNWALAYRGQPRIVYGHTAVRRAAWINRTLDIDTGCVFGGSLTALRYPELELAAVKAARVYYVKSKPLAEPGEGIASP